MDIAEWLRGLGLGQYVEAFAANDIGAEILPELTAEDLKDLGVLSVGHRRRLLAAIAALRERAPPAAAGPTAPAEAERRQVIVLFCDLVGSTALSSRLDPEDVRALLGRYHACVAETVRGFDGFVAKYMGDGVLVYFGYPCRARGRRRAGGARGAGAGRNRKRPPPRPSPAPWERKKGGQRLDLPLPLAGEGWGEGSLQVRIGIASGLVVVGDLIGQGSAQEQAIVGETPNLAVRLQALAEPGAALIDGATRRQIGALFELVDLGPQTLKGFAEPQRAFRVLSENRALGRFEALRSRATPLVGRAEELDLLLRRWTAGKAGAGRVVLICAEAGLGKSRLTEALAERIGAEPHIRLRYFCSPHHQDSALYPIITQMERAAGFARADGTEAKLGKLRALLTLSLNARHCEDPGGTPGSEAISAEVRKRSGCAVIC